MEVKEKVWDVWQEWYLQSLPSRTTIWAAAPGACLWTGVQGCLLPSPLTGHHPQALQHMLQTLTQKGSHFSPSPTFLYNALIRTHPSTPANRERRRDEIVMLQQRIGESFAESLVGQVGPVRCVHRVTPQKGDASCPWGGGGTLQVGAHCCAGKQQ